MTLCIYRCCSSSVGKIPINVSEYDIDMLSFSGHKIYGPKGIGCYMQKEEQEFIH